MATDAVMLTNIKPMTSSRLCQRHDIVMRTIEPASEIELHQYMNLLIAALRPPVQTRLLPHFCGRSSCCCKLRPQQLNVRSAADAAMTGWICCDSRALNAPCKLQHILGHERCIISMQLSSALPLLRHRRRYIVPLLPPLLLLSLLPFIVASFDA